MDTLIRFWLHQEPGADMEDLTEQVARALWMEQRTFRQLGDIISRAFGGKR